MGQVERANMKFVSLVFDYDLDKMFSSGRIWGQNGYRNKSYIFQYSSASIATVLDKNPHVRYEVLTNDRELLLNEIAKYDVDTTNLFIIDRTATIKQWSTHRYCFWPAVKYFDEALRSGERFIKLDNDLTCKKKADELFEFKGSIVWKKERLCSKGRDYWGESFASRVAFGTVDFWIYNIGVSAFSDEFVEYALELPSLCEKLTDVDISSIVHFPESPQTRVTMWSCSEQTAICYLISKYNIPVLEAHDVFDHHCYTTSKSGVIESAVYLLKK